MARARNIKPGFFKNEQLVELSFECRLLFAGLWTLADREGRLEDRPKRIKMEIFPADSVDVDECLTQLHMAGLILRYTVDDARYIAIPQFLKHQNPHHREAASEIPRPPIEEKPGQPEASPRQALGKPSASRADSLIPDSGFSDSGEKTCAEPCGSPPSAPPDPPVESRQVEPVEPVEVVVRLPTNRHATSGETFDVTRQMADEYGQIYPAVDVEQALRSMLGWCLANPTKRKTHGGTPKFINAWLAKDQNSGGHHAAHHRPVDRPRAPTPAERVQAKRARAPGGASALGAVGADVRDVRPYLVTGSGR